MKRWFKYKYLLLLRAKGGASKVAAGFSIGLAIEMFTLPTVGLAFFLIFPLVYFMRASLGGALIGFIFGKIIYFPLAFMNNRVGGLIVGDHFLENIHFLNPWMEKMIYLNMKLIVGGMIDGAILGLIFYFPVKFLLQWYAHQRRERRKLRKTEASP